MKIAYADPPYPGCAKKHYGCEEVDHAALISDLEDRFDGWALSTHVPGLIQIAPLLPKGVRIMAWCKPFAFFKPNTAPGYAWEPVIVRQARHPVVSEAPNVAFDWFMGPVAKKDGIPGAKSWDFCRWVFWAMGAQREDEFHDLFKGSGSVADSWYRWSGREQQAEILWTPKR